MYTGIFFKFHDFPKFMYVKFSMFMTLEVKKFCKWVNSQKVSVLEVSKSVFKSFFLQKTWDSVLELPKSWLQQLSS